MTDKTSLTVRLTPERDAKLQQITDQLDTSSKSEALRQLIDERFEEHQSQPPTSEPAPASTNNTHDPEPADSSAPVTARTGELTLVEEEIQGEETVNVVADGGETALANVPDNTSTAKLNPFSDQDFTNIKQNSDRPKAVRCALNYLHDEMGIKRQSKPELRRLVDEMFKYSSRHRDQFVDQMIERGDVLPDILEDPLLRERVDRIVRRVYQDADWADYMSRRDAGELPETVEEVLEEVYFNNCDEGYYLDEQAYATRVEAVLDSVEGAVLRLRSLYESSRGEAGKVHVMNRREERYRLVVQMYKAMLDVVAQRTCHWDQPIVENAEERYVETLR